jgi:hypothetical protein
VSRKYVRMVTEVLLTKDQIAEKLSLTRRGVECIVKAGKIPVIRISKNCVRFSWPRVEAALKKLEIRAVGQTE